MIDSFLERSKYPSLYIIYQGDNMEEIMQEIIKFQSERDWKQFHTPENLAKSISIEAA